MDRKYRSLTQNNSIQRTGGRSSLSYVPSLNTISKSLGRKRKLTLDLPALPKSWGGVAVPDSLKVTPDCQDFVILMKILRVKSQSSWVCFSDNVAGPQYG